VLQVLGAPPRNASARRYPAALGLMAASGFAGLGYQIVWTQQSTLWLGHESAAVLAVVAAFFGGLAVGAFAFAARIERSLRPARWYAACEALIAIWCLVLAAALAPIGQALLQLIGAQPTPVWQWSVAFVGTFLVLLPATAAMGATLSAMERVLAGFAPGTAQGSHAGSTDGWSAGSNRFAALYAANTFGAVLGVLAAAFWLVPEFGLARTAALCAALNVVCALIALKGFDAALPPAPGLVGTAPASALWTLAATGLLGLGYEVLVVRVLSQVAEDTVYTFALLLAVYLVGTALGAAAYQRWRAHAPDLQALHATRTRLLAAQALACLVGIASLWFAEIVRETTQHTLGGGMAAALGAEATLALLAFGVPTLAMGALFSHLSEAARRLGHGYGRALAANTLGAALAPLVFGVALAPALGAKAALLAVVAGYLALALPRMRDQPWLWAGTALASGGAAFAPPLSFIDVPEGGRILSYAEGAAAAVSVVEDAQGVARLHINNRQQEGSSASGWADSRQALLPLALHAAPRHALFLGLGTGVTASAAALDPVLQVDAVELLPEVIDASIHFRDMLGAGARVPHVMAADARRYVRATGRRYDLIVSDNFHPARSGSGALYTVEHFRAVRERLGAMGLFCQWLPLHQLDLATLRSIVAAFNAAFPEGLAMLATNSLDTPVLGLIGRADAAGFDLRALGVRLAQAPAALRLAEFGIADEFALLGSFVAGPRALRDFAAGAPLNTDDRPVVAYRAPRVTYMPDSLPRERLLALLDAFAIAPQELLAPGAAAGSARRLAAYWVARRRYLEAGQRVVPSADARQMLAQVREPLLAVLRISPDFRPAYDPLLRMAVALARSDAAGARSLLTELKQAQPARPDADLALARLAP
jgi:spermidine synthase